MVFGHKISSASLLCQGVMAVLAGISLWISAIVSHCEQNAYLSQKNDLENLLKGAALSKISKQE